ncbi:MAG: serine protease [Deltaproteobacteria bacterium]|nr:serine protease [Deltaproteobacteria bacterium]
MKTRYSIPILAAILLAFAVMVWPVATPVTQTTPVNLRDTVHIVTIVAPDGTVVGNGSGVMVAPRLMLTAAHVSGIGDRTLRVGIEQAPAKVIKVDVLADIALLQVALGCPCAPVAWVNPQVDAEAIAIGHPSFNHAATQILTTGRIQGYVPSDRRLMFSAPISGGNSGGGLFVDGELVGIVVELISAGDGMFTITHIFHLARAVDTKTMIDFYFSYKPPRVDPKLNDYAGGRLG